jgi:hypothetical protein
MLKGLIPKQPLFGEPLVTSSGHQVVAEIDVTQPTDPWEQSLQWAAPMWNRCNVSAHFFRQCRFKPGLGFSGGNL